MKHVVSVTVPASVLTSYVKELVTKELISLEKIKVIPSVSVLIGEITALYRVTEYLLIWEEEIEQISETTY